MIWPASATIRQELRFAIEKDLFRKNTYLIYTAHELSGVQPSVVLLRDWPPTGRIDESSIVWPDCRRQVLANSPKTGRQSASSVWQAVGAGSAVSELAAVFLDPSTSWNFNANHPVIRLRRPAKDRV